MTSEERAQFVHNTIFNCTTLNDAIRDIIAKWEDDVDDAFERGQAAFRESQLPEG